MRYLLLDKLPVVPLLMVVLMLLYGIAGMEQPAVQASIPILVKREKVLAANAIVNQVSSIANFMGPILGGMLFGIGGVVPILQISSICFFMAAVMELFITIPYEKSSKSKRILQIVQNDLLESSRFIRYKKPVWRLIAGGVLTSIFAKRLRVEKAFILLILCSGCTLIMWITISVLVHTWGNTVLGGMYTITTLINFPSLKTIVIYTPQILLIAVIIKIFDTKMQLSSKILD